MAELQTFFKHDIPSRKRLKGRKDRAEATVKKSVREEVFERDDCCRVLSLTDSFRGRGMWWCDGEDQWAHLFKKSASRNQPAPVRHSTATSVRLCRRHHAMEEGRERPRLRWRYLTDAKANGPIEWTVTP